MHIAVENSKWINVKLGLHEKRHQEKLFIFQTISLRTLKDIQPNFLT